MRNLLLTLLLFFLSIDVYSQSWVKRSSTVPVARANAVGFSGSNHGYITTGNDQNQNSFKDLWEYTPQNKSWRRLTDFPADARKNAISFSIGDSAFVGAGTAGSTHKRDMYRYNIPSDTWDTLSNYPGQGLRLNFNTSCNGKGYVGGGVGSGVERDFYEYNPLSDTWRSLGNFPFGDRSSGVCFAIDDTVYFGLGYNGSIDFTDLWAYSINDSTWSQKASFLGVGRVRANVMVMNGRAIVGGGFEVGQTTMLTDYYEYDPQTNQWTSITAFPNAGRSASATFKVGAQAFIFGGSIANNLYDNDLWGYGLFGSNAQWFQGINQPPVSRTNAVSFSTSMNGFIACGNQIGGGELNDFWKYDPISNFWSQLADFPAAARKNAIGFVIGNFAYIGLGSASSVEKSDFYRYDLINEQWDTLNNYPGNASRLLFHAVADGKAYVGGGWDAGNPTNDFYEYNPSSDSWRALSNLPFGNRSSGISFSYQDTVYFGLGYNGPSDFNDLWAYSVKDSSWTQKASYLGVGRIRAGAAASNNGSAIAGGGFSLGSSNSYHGDYYLYNIAANQWNSISGFTDSARAAFSSFNINNDVYIFGGATSNGASYLNDLWVYSMNVTDLNEVINYSPAAIVYPNPTNGLINCTIKEPGELLLFDLNGKQLRSKRLNSSSLVDISNFANGTYFYQFRSVNSIESGKIVLFK